MSNLTLIIGTKRYSSWSLRPWLALKQAGLAFDEVEITLRQPESKAQILAHSPSGKVPLLKDGNLLVWDSLAICEYAAELACAVPLWPESPGARALARSISAEMHSGFPGLRQQLPMDVAATLALPQLAAETEADIRRIQAIWNECRSRHGAGGAFLFGGWTIADAMFAPVATRFQTYGVVLDEVSRAYVDATMALPAMHQWVTAAKHKE